MFIEELLEDILLCKMEQLLRWPRIKLIDCAFKIVENGQFLTPTLLADDRGSIDKFAKSATYAFTHRNERRNIRRHQLRSLQTSEGWEYYGENLRENILSLTEEYVERCKHNLPSHLFFEKVLHMYEDGILQYYGGDVWFDATSAICALLPVGTESLFSASL